MTFLRSIFKSEIQDSNQFELLDTSQYKKAVINKDVQLVDVRTPGEYRKGHIGRALNIDFYAKEQMKKAFEQLDKNKPVYLYCRSGFRSRKVAKKLIEWGFSKIYDLKGGLNNWH